MFLFNLLTSLLPARLQPYAKAIYPSIATAVAVGVQWVNDGSFDSNALRTAIVGAVGSLLVFLLPNKPAGA